jgi:hypothetical protein
MKKLKVAIILFVPLFCLASAVSADVPYDNLSSHSDGVDSIAVVGPMFFDSFSTGPSGFNLVDVKLLLMGSPSPGSLTVDLYSDSSTSPGAPLLNIGTLSDNELPSTLSVVDFALGSPYALAANTRYWLVLDSLDYANISSVLWSWSLDQSAIGVAGEYFGHDDPFVFSNIWGPYQMQLSDTPTVPEPATMILLGSGLIGVLGLKRKLRK